MSLVRPSAGVVAAVAVAARTHSFVISSVTEPPSTPIGQRSRCP